MKPRKLSNLKINAIALVGKAANRRKFLLFKNQKIEKDNTGGEQKMGMTVEQLQTMLEEMMKKMDTMMTMISGEGDSNSSDDEKIKQELNNENMMKQVKEIVTEENIAILKSAIELLEKAEQMSDQEKNKKAQEERSAKYGIAIKDGGSVTKPSEYSSLSDEQFADPVNYSYPIDESHVVAAYKYFAQSDNQKLYSAEEQKIIWNKIVDALPKDMQEDAKKIAGITKEEKPEEDVIDNETIEFVKKINEGLK